MENIFFYACLVDVGFFKEVPEYVFLVQDLQNVVLNNLHGSRSSSVNTVIST